VFSGVSSFSRMDVLQLLVYTSLNIYQVENCLKQKFWTLIMSVCRPMPGGTFWPMRGF
jgi:hypothetical protein